MIKLMKIDLQLSVPGPFALVEMTNALDKARLDTGQTSAPTWQAVHVNIEDDRESPPGLTDLILTVPFTMASKRLVELFELFNCDCEYLPLVVHYHDQTHSRRSIRPLAFDRGNAPPAANIRNRS